MNDQSSMFPPTTSEAIDSITSLPASADGPTRSGSQGGATTGPSGPEAARVSRFRAQASERAMPTNDTSGPLFTHSSPSADLQSSLESRLRASLDANGSQEYALTWKHWDMPAGPPICALRARAPRTSGNGCSGWPTPCVSPGDYQYSSRDHDKIALKLSGAAKLAGWPSPTKGNADGSQMAKGASTTGRRPDGSKATVSLNQVAQSAGWATPRANDGTGAKIPPGREGGVALKTMAGWATPTTRDHKSGGADLTNSLTRKDGKPRNDLMDYQAFGAGQSSSPAPTEKRGALNPAFSLWLMGYTTEWARCAARVTRSSRKSPRRS